MRTGLLLLALAGLPASEALELEIDTTVVDQVMASMDAGGLTPNALFALEESAHVQRVVDEAAALGLPAHVNGYLDSLDAVAAGDTLPADFYGFQQVLAMQQGIRDANQRIGTDPASTAAAIEAGIRPFVESDLPAQATLVLVAGAATCAGVYEDLSRLFLDLRCVAERPDGIAAMFAHALAHTQLAQANYSIPTDPKLAQLDMMLSGAVSEAGAAVRSDGYALGIPAHFGAFDPVAHSRNEQRAQETWTVTQAFLHSAGHDRTADMATLEQLLLAGPWEAPLQWLSYTVVATLAANRDAAAMEQLLAGPPEEVFMAYAELSPALQPIPISDPTIEVMHALAAARSGSAVEMTDPDHAMDH
jgi:hypothetical protein